MLRITKPVSSMFRFITESRVWMSTVFVVVFLTICSRNEGTFLVRVFDPERQPVADARIWGGIDWGSFSVDTDEEGWALLPGYARGEHAVIIKNNYHPRDIEVLYPGTYIIEPTPQKLDYIGDVVGSAILFNNELISTIAYHGEYRVYSYDDESVNEIATAPVPRQVSYHKLYGNTVWFSTYDAGFYAYSLDDPLQPDLICHIDIPGYTNRPFAVRDTILAVGSHGESSKIYSFNFDGDYEELSSLDSFWVSEMIFISHYLVIVGNNNHLPTVYDMQDPTDPEHIFTNSEPVGWGGFLYETYVVLQDRYGGVSASHEYRLIDMKNPESPIELGTFPTEANLETIVCDTEAIGGYGYYPIAVLHGFITDGFSVAATVIEDRYLSEQSGFPPYYHIGGKLWKLVDQ